MHVPANIGSEEQLDDLLSEPTPAVVETMRRLDGDLVLLGVAGKMGPTLARMARRASDAAGVRRRIIGVSRFTSGSREALEAHGVETMCCDLLDQDQVARLPHAPNVLYLAGMKFGATGNEPLTWAMNSYLPGVICHKYRQSRIVAFSTGNVYGLTPVERGGSEENDPLQPVGEYAMSCLGRERVFTHFSRAWSIPMALIRLNYACELRYGVLADLARKVWADEVIDLSMGYFNAIWQGDANAMTLRAFDHTDSPPVVLNVAGEQLAVRDVCERFGQLLKRTPRFVGIEASTALLSKGQCCRTWLGRPAIGSDQMMEWIANWVAQGGRSLDKPTHFESRDGRF